MAKSTDAIDESMQKFIYELKEQRERKNISTAKMSELTGIKQPNITRLETLKVQPTLKTIILYCDALDIDIMGMFRKKSVKSQ